MKTDLPPGYTLSVQHIHRAHELQGFRQRKKLPRYATVATIMDPKGVAVAVGVSRCSHLDSPSRKVGHDLAVQRALRDLKAFFLDNRPLPAVRLRLGEGSLELGMGVSVPHKLVRVNLNQLAKPLGAGKAVPLDAKYLPGVEIDILNVRGAVRLLELAQAAVAAAEQLARGATEVDLRKLIDDHTTQPGLDGPGEEDGPWAAGWKERSTGKGKIENGCATLTRAERDHLEVKYRVPNSSKSSWERVGPRERQMKACAASAAAFNLLHETINKDPMTAWSWHCCLAVPLMDSGLTHYDANVKAARLMRSLWDVDMEKNENYTGLLKQIDNANREAAINLARERTGCSAQGFGGAPR